ncbi:hypothetical protein, partial [Acinetobacter variabilis]|uniref:hypothetical protein n=1 Tax=Acinetobacter variabilis TaxID=70346 RepID=UPI00289CA31D
MHNHVDHRWIQTLLRKIISVLLIYSIFFSSQANAASVGGWTLGGGVTQGASTVFDGTKKVVIDGADFIKKGTAKITPSASAVAKVLARGAAGYALSVAVEQLLGSVEWILDPANNQIKYWETVQAFQSQANYGGIKIAQSQTEACQISIDYVKSNTAANYSRVVNGGITLNGNQLQCRILAYRATAPNSPLEFLHYWSLTDVKQDQPKTLPLETVAQKVISNAEAGDKNAQAATSAAAADIVGEAATDSSKARPIVNQLEASANTKPADQAAAEKANEAQGQSKPNESNPETMDLSLEFPVFCNWAPIVCEAAQKTINMAANMSDWFNDVIQAQEKTEQTIKTESSKIIASNELVKNSVDTGNRELKGELVNVGSAVKDVEKAVRDGTTELKGELVNAGSAVKDVETAVKDGTTELKGELVNAGSAVKDVETAVKDGTTELKGELVNTGSAVKDVETAVKDGTTE